jgi:2-oxoglutarate dehydrogenase E1 component
MLMGNRDIPNVGLENSEYLEGLYTLYKTDPNSVDPQWKTYFSDLDKQSTGSNQAPTFSDNDAGLYCRAKDLVQAYREYGHLMAHINPLKETSPELPEQLHISAFGLNSSDLSREVPGFGVVSEAKTTLGHLIDTLQRIYCGHIGYEFTHLQNSEREQWIQQRVESQEFQADLNIDDRREILKNLNHSELFEVFLHTKYVGQKRFSLEGGESMIPVLNKIIEAGASLGVQEFYIGMAHRGRLNVLTNILKKSYAEVFSEFDESYIPDSFEGSGDVKYHKGFVSDVVTSKGNKAKVLLAPNPSHLESIDPVVEGMVRSRQDQRKDNDRDLVVPVLIHGDAALAGQGIVYETLQMYKLDGYTTGGTIHVVINNQIGFTTEPKDDRSTLYCTDLAKGFGAPVFHVNGEDPEACVKVAKLAAEIRQKFQCDVFIDIVCYRKYGHNEADEPAFTQPSTYDIIRKKKPVRDLYVDFLVHGGHLEKKLAETLEAEFKKALQDNHDEIKDGPKNGKKGLYSFTKDETLFNHIMTGITESTINEIATTISKVPDNIAIHPKIASLTKDRLKMAEGHKPLDWGTAEILAYASLLWQGVNIRISGQDVCRGTFSHRHAMWVDQKNNNPYFPLKHLKDKQGTFSIYNSLLSEFAVLGFEFGYSIVQPDALVIWEAQFGDFANGAQIIIDQYVTTAEQKWGQKVNLVMLLPHGYEGQGPEHSSGRIERYLALAGNDNIQVVNCTSPAQLFHLLRRQALRSIRKPLIVFTPKGLLRHPECISFVDDLTKGSFMEILPDPKPPEKPTKVAFCTGRIYYDLIAERNKDPHPEVAIVRLEQLYPLDEARLNEAIKRYPTAEQYFWVQEEHENMGAWDYIQRPLQKLLPENAVLNYIGRPRSASTAAGSYSLHKNEFKNIILSLFPPKQPSIFDMAGQHKSP